MRLAAEQLYLFINFNDIISVLSRIYNRLVHAMELVVLRLSFVLRKYTTTLSEALGHSLI